MSLQTQSITPNIVWDDSVVFVFSFTINSQTFFAGFVHLQIALANAVGSATQITNVLQQIQQSQVQFSSDPQSWLETVKNAARNSKPITIAFDDSTSVHYTTQIATSFDLQLLFSVAG